MRTCEVCEQDRQESAFVGGKATWAAQPVVSICLGCFYRTLNARTGGLSVAGSTSSTSSIGGVSGVIILPTAEAHGDRRGAIAGLGLGWTEGEGQGEGIGIGWLWDDATNAADASEGEEGEDVLEVEGGESEDAIEAPKADAAVEEGSGAGREKTDKLPRGVSSATTLFEDSTGPFPTSALTLATTDDVAIAKGFSINYDKDLPPLASDATTGQISDTPDVPTSTSTSTSRSLMPGTRVNSLVMLV
ncbi:hypothetical protein M427DRAFT_141379 [Gonapodya prolifera JEL478]|uniref:Uncharacterized protein n=1 Tax=Gonapodya prolifera (strain JEL478) TaxID=1344416 RepID=A0A138ZX96_GONPJ|nr:hypothetical protein M427DRAFT_141379 [Gonapodya prolifera JEL478]|eukprot:KXS09132.1 hypothetical protein M427DRAFT_141379 [Gonapodya prolifera JEL478]